MAVNIDEIRKILQERMTEAMQGCGSQNEIGKILNMTQGNVSKLLSGNQMPGIDTLCQIAESFNVSTDWLLGLSNNKERAHNSEITYDNVLKVLMALRINGAKIKYGDAMLPLVLEISDPFVKNFLKKADKLKNTDRTLYDIWIKNISTLFKEAEIISTSIWDTDEMVFFANDADKDESWVEVCMNAKELEKEYVERACHGPAETVTKDEKK